MDWLYGYHWMILVQAMLNLQVLDTKLVIDSCRCGKKKDRREKLNAPLGSQGTWTVATSIVLLLGWYYLFTRCH